MQFFVTDDNHNISAVSRVGTSGNYNLHWDTRGLGAFLIIAGDTEAEVSLKEDADNNLRETLNQNESSLFEQRRLKLDLKNTMAYIIDFAELRRKGGFALKERPGVYAVYGCDNKDGEWNIYIPERNNTIQHKIDIEIKVNPVMEEKGLFKKTPVYTGFCRVTIPRGIEGIGKGAIYYIVGANNYKYPVPQEIIAKGGSFFVKCANDEQVEFGTDNRDVIRIK